GCARARSSGSRKASGGLDRSVPMSRSSCWGHALVLAVLAGAARVAMADVTVVDPWVRGTVEGQTSTVAYMTLKSDTAVRLVSVSSPAAARCSVHETTISGNLMKMR